MDSGTTSRSAQAQGEELRRALAELTWADRWFRAMRREALSGDYDKTYSTRPCSPCARPRPGCGPRAPAAPRARAAVPPCAFPSRSRRPSTGCTSLAGW
jgi:hypothetical protein